MFSVLIHIEVTMKFLRKPKMRSLKINNEKLKLKWLIELMFKSLLIDLGTMLIVLPVSKAKLKCLKNCKSYYYCISFHVNNKLYIHNIILL